MPEAMTPTMSVEDILHRLFNTPEGRADPYPLYRELQGAPPVFRNERDGLWYTCRLDLLDPEPPLDRGFFRGRTSLMVAARSR